MVLFSINNQLCKEYPAFDPYRIDETAFYKVIKLYAETRALQIQQKKLSDPDRMIRKRAGDDWF